MKALAKCLPSLHANYHLGQPVLFEPVVKAHSPFLARKFFYAQKMKLLRNLEYEDMLLSNPFHARAEWLRKSFLMNPMMQKFEQAKVGEFGVIIGSMPNNLYLYCAHDIIKLVRIADSKLPQKKWKKIYGKMVMIAESGSSAFGYHAVVVVDEEKLKERLKNLPQKDEGKC